VIVDAADSRPQFNKSVLHLALDSALESPAKIHLNNMQTGFIVLHGNRSEDLMSTTIAWLQKNPLDALEEENFLVQSSGMAEWAKMEVAHHAGVCAALNAELPARFLWRTYRQVLGPESVPRESALDKLPMTWRLMRVLPQLLDQAAFTPVARYLWPSQLHSDAPEASRLLQLCSQLADLFDQYQNYRADWLRLWTAGKDEVTDPQGRHQPLAPEHCWQPVLWRCVLDSLSPEQRRATRAELHLQAIAKLGSAEPLAGRLPRRVVAFGMSQLSAYTLEALAALAQHSQVILAVPNPCRFYWGDIMEGRELFRAVHRRHQARGGLALSSVDFDEMHLHANPLLAAWGRQGRDFVRQLDAFDDAVAARQAFPTLKLDLFDEQTEQASTPMLGRIQMRIRDMEPLSARHDTAPLGADDQSVVFHVAHSAVRELEVLHDQLLDLLAQPDLNPRDIVVMVPDVQSLAPAIRAVFGQYPRHDKRFIPFGIADLSAKSSSPIIMAVEWLLTFPANRCGLSELVDLLEVPAVARCLGIDEEKLPQLVQWMTGSGIRWGLHAEHRQTLDLGECGAQNSAQFGLQRMLLGYCTGSLDNATAPDGWSGIEPYTEIGGLDADLAGALAHLLSTLDQWWKFTKSQWSPAHWTEHGQWLLAAMFKGLDEADQQALSALTDALHHWKRSCEQAGFDQELPLSGLRHGWMTALQLPALDKRFRAGGVTFCTLMPMRAIPFKVVCLLGMNDSDYPRRTPRNDFDLMGQPGMFRPGDRARQQDDRQLMLEALLSARDVLYVSWTGFSIRDNSEQPPSVLVSQLRDYISAAWGASALDQRTVFHPLQPFSRRYFEADSALKTYASEWRSAHEAPPNTPASDARSVPVPLEASTSIDLDRLVRFFRNPVKAFFRDRLGVVFANPQEEAADTEAFELDGLENHQVMQALLEKWPAPPQSGDLYIRITADLDRLQRSGALPMRGLGELKRSELHTSLTGMFLTWTELGVEFPLAAQRVAVEHAQGALLVRDWIDGVFQNPAGERCWLSLEAGKLINASGKQPQPRPEKLLGAWLKSLLLACCGHQVQGRLIGTDGQLVIRPMDPQVAAMNLETLLGVWQMGQQEALPLPLKTALTLAAAPTQDGKAVPDSKAEAAYEGSGDAMSDRMAEVRDMCLARVYPDFEALCEAQTSSGQGLLDLAPMVYGPLLQWVTECVTAHEHPTAHPGREH
jgi:exodeoxyribonuclease V gamma subunit